MKILPDIRDFSRYLQISIKSHNRFLYGTFLDIIQGSALQGWKNMVKRKRLFLAVGVILLWGYWGFEMIFSAWKEKYSYIPDVHGSISVNNEYILSVFANRDKVEDRDEYARNIITMCRDNAFRSMKFSVDRNGYPQRLQISVYLNQEHFDQGEPLFEILYEPTEQLAGYDIKNNPEKFRLSVDGQEIEY